MRVFAVHEPDGTIASLTVCPDDGPRAGAMLRAGQQESEIEVEIEPHADDRELHRQLNDLAERSRIEVLDPPKARLVSK